MTAAHAQSVEQFYRGKTINMVIGFSVGGGYDIYARLLARHMSKHIPGNPTIVAQNMTGAGSLRAAQFIYAVAPKDGLTFGTFSRMFGINPLLDQSVAYDATKFNWLGSITHDVSLCFTYNSKVKNWQDFLAEPVVFGGQAVGSEIDIFANLYRKVFGSKIRVVVGYQGTNDITLAMERGEVEGVCGMALTSIKQQRPSWVAENKINILVQQTFRKPEIPNVPSVMDLAKTPEQQQIVKLFVSTHEFARPFALGPGVPADRVAAMTKAFDDTMRDPEFLAEAQKRDLDVAPVTANEMKEMLAELYKTPKDILEKAAAVMK
jgi:tripartite-type tricarboxylate transporter receptor subunit TctC